MEIPKLLKLANEIHKKKIGKTDTVFKIGLITNFTDDLFSKLLVGVGAEKGLHSTVTAMPYRQYPMLLGRENDPVKTARPDITFVLFDLHPYHLSEFATEDTHFDSVLAALRTYAKNSKGPVVISTFPLPYKNTHGGLFDQNKIWRQVASYNQKLKKLALEHKNIFIEDINRIIHEFGEQRARNSKTLMAFDIPYANEFVLALCREWFGYIDAHLGKTKKCIVLDLDNTLWGGVVGEAGFAGVTLGPDYPGNAYQSFQRALLDLSNRGIILAINSKNNLDDVLEILRNNPYMILKEKHFAAIKANWLPKTENISALAKELNIGLDAMVFIDDDPVNRESVSAKFPEVLVPDFSIPPEEYTEKLLSLRVFNQMKITAEDKKRTALYRIENARTEAKSGAADQNEFLKSLKIKMTVSLNETRLVPRAAQLTEKTNQFNLTTKRMNESDILNSMKNGIVFAGTISDKFGPYGTTVLAIVTINKDKTAELDNFLMSCRVMGRTVENVFMDYLLSDLKKRNVTTLYAEFIETAKNAPAKNFLADTGFKKTGAKGAASRYRFDLKKFQPSKKDYLIKITDK